jgi:pimeloyl-ACP methyl ester carboxylesterase
MIKWNLESYRAEQEPNQVIQPEVPAAERLDRLTMPVMLIWGTLDVTSVPASGERLAKEVPGARTHVFEGVAHMVNLERQDEFNKLVGEFLDSAERSHVSGGER